MKEDGRTEEKKERKSSPKGNRALGHQNQKRPKNEGKKRRSTVPVSVERKGAALMRELLGAGTRGRALE
jgi:hypothetical protein